MRHKKIIQEILGKELEKRDLLMYQANLCVVEGVTETSYADKD